MTLKTSPIPSRNWKNSKDPVTERDRKRKESKQSVDRRIHYLRFHFLKLCLELESMNHVFEKKGGGGKIIHGKGNHSKNNCSPMRSMVRKFLLNTNIVLAFCEAEIKDGGNGATYVLIKK